MMFFKKKKPETKSSNTIECICANNRKIVEAVEPYIADIRRVVYKIVDENTQTSKQIKDIKSILDNLHSIDQCISYIEKVKDIQCNIDSLPTRNEYNDLIKQIKDMQLIIDNLSTKKLKKKK